MKRFLGRLAPLSAVTALALLVGCGQSLHSAMPTNIRAVSTVQSVQRGALGAPMSDKQANLIIDPSLDASEREIVRRALGGLRTLAGDRQPDKDVPKLYDVAVIDGPTGKVYYNRRDLHNSLKAVPAIGLFETKPSEKSTSQSLKAISDIVPQNYTGKNTPDSGTGPYRRIYTIAYFDPAQTSLAFEQAHVTTQCYAGNLLNSNYPDGDKRKEAGHSYLGGWSSANYALDAGLIYNRSLTSGSNDDYSPFMAIQGASQQPYAGIEIDHTTGNSVNWHIPCSTYGVDLAFYVDGPTSNFNLQQVEIITGYKYFDPQIQGNRQIDLIYLTGAPGPSWAGWSPNCGGCVFKRMTSLAHIPQSNGGPADDFGNTDAYHATWSNMKVSCGFVGYACQSDSGQVYSVDANTNAIASCQEYPSWTAPYDNGKRDCSNMPPNAVSHVSVFNFQFSGEEDDIILNPTHATPSPTTPPQVAIDQVMSVLPTLHVESDGIHMGVNISNNKSGLIQTYKFPNSGLFNYIVYDASGNVVYNLFAGKRFTQSIYWLTWQLGETKHNETVWAGYTPGQTYTFVVQIKSYYGVTTAQTKIIAPS